MSRSETRGRAPGAVRRAASLLVVLSLLVGLQTANAKPGDLDEGFGTDGAVTTDHAAVDLFTDITVLDDGKILAAGLTCGVSDCDVALARYTPDGSPDLDFGGGGVRTTDLGGDDRTSDLVVDDHGRIVVTGTTCSGDEVCDVFLARFDSAGVLDATFAGDGVTIVDLGGTDVGAAVALHGPRKIVVAGSSCISANCDSAVARFEDNGNLDGAFGDGGVVVADHTGKDLNDEVQDVLVMEDRKILVGGSLCTQLACDFSVTRYSRKGSLNRGYGKDGTATTSFGGHEKIESLATQEDGRIVAAGFTCRPGADCDFALSRYKVKGKVDEGFGQKGMVVSSFGAQERAHDVVVQDDGRLVAVGATCVDDICEFALARYDTSGAADATFGVNGKVSYAIGPNDGGFAATRPGLKELVVAGKAGSDFALLQVQLGPSVIKEASVVSIDYRERSGKLKGFVDSGRRRCKSGRSVELRRRGAGAVAVTETGRRGGWEFSGPRPAGRYRVKVAAMTYHRASGTKIVCQKTRSIRIRVP